MINCNMASFYGFRRFLYRLSTIPVGSSRVFVLLFAVGLWGCAGSPGPVAETGPEITGPEPTESRWLANAQSRRAAQPGLRPDDDLVQLGILASAAVNLANGVTTDTLIFHDDPQVSADHARSTLEPVWNIFSREDLLTTMDILAYTGGFPGIYRRVLNLMLDNPEGLKQPDLYLDPGFWDPYLAGHPDAIRDVQDLVFVVQNRQVMALSAFGAFELGRLSSLVRWGYAAGYLAKDEALIFMEDIGLILAATSWDFPLLAHAQIMGMALLNQNSSNFQTATTQRGIEVWRLLQESPWQQSRWDQARDSGELTLPDFFPRFTGDLPSVSGETGLSPEVYALFDPESDPQSLLPYYRKDYNLYKAIRDNDLADLTTLLSNNRYVDGLVVNGTSWTFHAVPHHQTLAVLLEAGFSPNLAGPYNYTPLYRAADEENLESMRLLIKYGAEVEPSPAVNSFTPLTVCLDQDFSEGLNLLLEHGADPNADSIYGEHPLTYAVVNGNLDIVVSLLDHGADPNTVTATGVPVIVIAARMGDRETVQALLVAGADIPSEE